MDCMAQVFRYRFHAVGQFVKRRIDQHLLSRAVVTVQKSRLRLVSHSLDTSTIVYSGCTVCRAELNINENSTVFQVVTPCKDSPKFR
jgi:hypothetical protein